jgi:hypothetical protein
VAEQTFKLKNVSRRDSMQTLNTMQTDMITGGAVGETDSVEPEKVKDEGGAGGLAWAVFRAITSPFSALFYSPKIGNGEIPAEWSDSGKN